MLRYISILSQSLINSMDDAIISIYKQFTNQSIMTTWAVQPTYWGNELRSWAEYATTWEQIEDLALSMAEETMEEMTIYKVGSVSSFKWATRGGLG